MNLRPRTLLATAVVLTLAGGCGGGDRVATPSRAALDAESHTLALSFLTLDGITCAYLGAGGMSFEYRGGVLIGLVTDSNDPAVWTAAGRAAITAAWTSGLAPVTSVELRVLDSTGRKLADQDDVLGAPEGGQPLETLVPEKLGPRPDPLPSTATTDPGPAGCDVPGITPTGG